MSNGGLLQKDIDQQATDDTSEPITIIAENIPGEEIPISKIFTTLFVGALLPMIVLMWFGIYLDFISLNLL